MPFYAFDNFYSFLQAIIIHRVIYPTDVFRSTIYLESFTAVVELHAHTKSNYLYCVYKISYL